MPKHIVYNPKNNEAIYEYDYTSYIASKEIITKLKHQGGETQKKLSPLSRSKVLLRLKDLLLENKEKLSKQITLETGKLIVESRIEVERALITVEIAAEEAKRVLGEATPDLESANGKMSITKKCPYGLVMCITPFNFPLNLALHKIAPAFAVGNSILLKPSECNFELAKILVDLCHKAGMDEEIIQTISPSITDLNNIIQEPSIDIISFTGGTETANKISKLAGRKKILLELGGNDSLIFFPDGDLDLAVKETITGRFGTGGQKCTASKRIFIHESVYEDFKNELLLQAKPFEKFEPQDPLDDNSIFSPLVSENSAKKVYKVVDDAISRGASLVWGHKRVGAYYAPTILENIPEDSDVICEETFGPVISLIKFSSEQKLISMVNSTKYGLQSGIFTNNLILIKELFDKIEVGTLIVNQGPGYRKEHLPFGGVKDSGLGREGIKYAMEEMSYIKQLIF
jgi:acyl-CoA reductase-like NAD-dependent aldehyde dehydrogenase